MSGKKTDFEWREARPRRTGMAAAFLCGVAITAAAAVYAVDALRLTPETAPISVTETGVPVPDVPEIATSPARPAEKPLTVAEEAIKDRRDTTAIFAGPEAETDSKPAGGPATAPPASAAAEPTAHDTAAEPDAPQQPTIINRDADAPPATDPAIKPDRPPDKAASAKTAAKPASERRFREADREPPPVRRRPDYGPPVDPRGSGEGYWNGRDFN